MRHRFNLVADDFPEVVLRTATIRDCIKLKQWKNKNRDFFFFQKKINSKMQKKWFSDYLKRKKDFMHMVFFKKKEVGCIGFRILGAEADIYNVILGVESFRSRGVMSKAMHLLCSYIYSDFTKKIGVKVLRINPALEWYKKNSFQKKVKHENYYELKLNLSKFRPCKFRKIEYGIGFK